MAADPGRTSSISRPRLVSERSRCRLEEHLNRTLLLAALARGHTIVRGLLDADDVERMLDAPRRSIDIEPIAQSRDYRVRGTRQARAGERSDAGNAGTAFGRSPPCSRLPAAAAILRCRAHARPR
jgi:5-enolpyruvylshikimate-3-phosphate synthase